MRMTFEIIAEYLIFGEALYAYVRIYILNSKVFFSARTRASFVVYVMLACGWILHVGLE